MSCNKLNNINQNVPIYGTYDNTFHVIGTSKIKIINVTNTNYTLFIDGYIIAITEYYISDYIKVNAAETDVVVKHGEKTIINTELLLEGGGVYTFIINGNEHLLLNDDLECPKDNLIRVRFIHVANKFNKVNVLLNNYQFDDIRYLDSNVLETKDKHIMLNVTPYAFNPIKLHLKQHSIYTIILINKNNMLSIMNTNGVCYK